MQTWNLILPAHAKINLGLRVLGKRPDGFHQILTVFQEVAFHDTLYFRHADAAFAFTANHPDVPGDDANLIVRAVRLIEQATDCPMRVVIHLDKQIPLGAGLGGGSSNAAAALRGLNQLFDLRLSQADLATLGAQLGSDVAFFVYGGTALASGRGEQVQPLADLDPTWVLLVNPGLHVSSAWAYKNLNLKLTNFQGLNSVCPKFEEGQIAGIRRVLAGNALEEPVMRQYPVIREIKATIQACGAEWTLMSGSGSTVFGLFTRKDAAEHARRHLERQRSEHPDWLVVLTRTQQRT
jgi:4-diphosphocytidyl-2-C-methyl-D-erythritol kinase